MVLLRRWLPWFSARIIIQPYTFPILRIQDTLKKNSNTVHFCISHDRYQKRASQDYYNDVRIIISISLNFAQIRKNGPKRPKLQFLKSAQLEEKTSGLSTSYLRFLYFENCALWSCVNQILVQSQHDSSISSWKTPTSSIFYHFATWSNPFLASKLCRSRGQVMYLSNECKKSAINIKV